MQDAIQITITDVINRLHHLKGHDRFHLLMEYMEWLCLEDAEEILWVEPLAIKEEDK
tara:strand:- start:1304 stop:1474 length:171 start_codon:yes stop_codon:yes gene_type:complete